MPNGCALFLNQKELAQNGKNLFLIQNRFMPNGGILFLNQKELAQNGENFFLNQKRPILLVR